MVNMLANNEQKNIKALLVVAGVKQVDIARRLKTSRSFVSEVVSGKKRTLRVRRAIARSLGLKVSELWPPKKGAA